VPAPISGSALPNNKTILVRQTRNGFSKYANSAFWNVRERAKPPARRRTAAESLVHLHLAAQDDHKCQYAEGATQAFKLRESQ
jgi:hypothetical protein